MEIDDGVLQYKTNDPNLGVVHLLVTPKNLRDQVLESIHDSAGHQGIDRTLSLRKKRCYWRQWVKRCERCMLSEVTVRGIRPKIKSVLASKPLEVVSKDFTQLETARSDGRQNVLVITDVFTKYTVVVPTKNQKATTVAKSLVQEWFHWFGIPDRIHSEQGRNFE